MTLAQKKEQRKPSLEVPHLPQGYGDHTPRERCPGSLTGGTRHVKGNRNPALHTGDSWDRVWSPLVNADASQGVSSGYTRDQEQGRSSSNDTHPRSPPSELRPLQGHSSEGHTCQHPSVWPRVPLTIHLPSDSIHHTPQAHSRVTTLQLRAQR